LHKLPVPDGALKMARKKTSRTKEQNNASFTFSSLHQRVANALSNDIEIGSTWFNHNGGANCENEYSTHVMGKFTCTNPGCSKGSWTSKKVAIQIRGYRRNGYNAVVFGQRCAECKRLGSLALDENSYVERVVYRLRKWAGVWVGKQQYSSKEGPPHKRELCEGCKRGCCKETDRWDGY
jgi:hypothetical protein